MPDINWVGTVYALQTTKWKLKMCLLFQSSLYVMYEFLKYQISPLITEIKMNCAPNVKKNLEVT